MAKYFRVILVILMILGFILGYILGDISADVSHIEDDGEPSISELLERVK